MDTRCLCRCFLLNEEQKLIDNILNPEITEFWMRSLIIIIFVSTGLYSRKVLKRHIEIDKYLLDKQQNLEVIIAKRTQALENLANTDSLTHIFNRRKISSLIENEHARYLRNKMEYSVIIIDLDNFKSINDRFGHGAGDNALFDFATLVKNNIRKSDQLARWGGEEFLILLPDTNTQSATTLAEHIRKLTETHSFNIINKLTISIGVASIKEDETIDQLLKRADDALYDAKNNGRNRIVIAND